MRTPQISIASASTRSVIATGLVLLALLFTLPTRAQWKKIADGRPGALGTLGYASIYFQEEVGAPQVGFAYGSDSAIKTTDGGFTWRKTTRGGFDDYSFKDQLNGWAVTSDFLFRTTNGGETWEAVPSFPNSDATGVYYNKKSGGLFVLNDFLLLASFDEGQTWQRVTNSSFNSGGFAFLNDNVGIASWSGLPGGVEWLRTTDAGLSWNPIGKDSAVFQPLAVPGTQTFFACTMWGTVVRSDDAGDHWRVLSRIPPQAPLTYQHYDNSGCIAGELDNLIVQNDSGCFRSTDQGLTWKYLCGVISYDGQRKRFYARKNRIFISRFDGAYNMWYLNLDSMQYFDPKLQTSVRSNIIPGDTASVNLLVQPDSLIGVDSIHLVIRYGDAIDLRGLQIPSGWRMDSTSANSKLDLWLTAHAKVLPKSILTLIFGTALGNTKIYLDTVHFYGNRLNCDCPAISTGHPDSVTINFTGCGDSTLVEFMRTGTLVHIDRIVPNPAKDLLTLEGKGLNEMQLEIYDALGRQIPIVPISSSDKVMTLDFQRIPPGMYFARIGRAQAEFQIVR